MRKAAFLFTALLSFLFLFGILFAALGELPTAISSLCGSLTTLLPVVGMLMVLVAAVVYATGQVMGAETRARGNVWATAALGGALMALLIVAVSPGILGAIFGSQVSCSPNCGGNPLPMGMACCTSPDGVGNADYNPSTTVCCTTPAFPANLWTCVLPQTCLAASPWCA